LCGYNSLSFSPDGKYLAAAAQKDFVLVWELKDVGK